MEKTTKSTCDSISVFSLCSCLTDPDILAQINELAAPVDELGMVVVGETFVQLTGDSVICRMRECNLGNLIADAMLESFVTYNGGESWSTVGISLMNGGGIRTTVDQGIIICHFDYC